VYNLWINSGKILYKTALKKEMLFWFERHSNVYANSLWDIELALIYCSDIKLKAEEVIQILTKNGFLLICTLWITC